MSKPRIWWALRQYGPFVHAPTAPPWSFGPRPAYVAAPDQGRPCDVDASVQHLVRRYLEGFGPATMQDIAQFSTIYRPPVQSALEALGDSLERCDGPGKDVLYDVPGGAVPDEDVTAPPRLLPMWDSVLLAHADRRRIITDADRAIVVARNGDTLPTFLVDGVVAGLWWTAPGSGGRTAIHLEPFRPIPAAARRALEAEADRLRSVIEPIEPLVYRRYQRWRPAPGAPASIVD